VGGPLRRRERHDEVALVRRLEVAAGAERLVARAGQHRHQRVLVVAEARPGVDELVRHRRADRVHPLGTVERDDRDGPVLLVADVFISHGRDRIPHRMSTAETKSLIEEGVRNFQQEVPALQQLKLVIELELRGRGDIQLFRVEVPGPKVTRDIASDAKVRLSVPRSDFNTLVREGKVRHWREAFESGTVKASGPPEILRLIQNVVEKQEERGRTRKLRTR
jgi:hypothetical protein